MWYFTLWAKILVWKFKWCPKIWFFEHQRYFIQIELHLPFEASLHIWRFQLQHYRQFLSKTVFLSKIAPNVYQIKHFSHFFTLPHSTENTYLIFATSLETKNKSKRRQLRVDCVGWIIDFQLHSYYCEAFILNFNMLKWDNYFSNRYYFLLWPKYSLCYIRRWRKPFNWK